MEIVTVLQFQFIVILIGSARIGARKNLKRWEWSMTAYTGVYEHTFLFEKEEHAKEFSKIWTRLH